MRTVLLLVSLLALAEAAGAAERAPKGWRFPVESDYSGNWQEFRRDVPVPFHVRADFDGDRLADDAWILIRADGDGWGLFVFLGRRGGRAKVVLLDNHPGNKSPQEHGIALAKPGSYKTACGKGYIGACEPGVPKVLRLKRPGIDSFYYEVTNTIYYWDKSARRFRNVLISD